MDLVRAGVLEQVPGRRACELTPSSLRIWMARFDSEPENVPTTPDQNALDRGRVAVDERRGILGANEDDRVSRSGDRYAE